MNTERFKQLLESTMGNVKPIVENNRTILKEESTNSPEIFIPYKKIKNEKGETVDVPAKEAYANSDYVTTFRILDSNRDTVKEITKNPSYLPYKLVSIELGGTAGGGILKPTGAQKFVIGNDGFPYLTGTLVVGSATPKLGIHTTGIVTKFSDTTTQRTGGVSIKKGKEYIPTQKESDLTRIVKRVINERQYLIEGDGIEHVKLQIAVPQRTDQNTKKTFYDYTAGVSFTVIPSDEQKKNMKSLRSITTVDGVRINLTPGQGLNSKFVAGADPQKRTQATDVLAPNFKPGSNITASGMDGTKVSIEKTDGTIISYLATPIIVSSFPLQY